MQTETAAGFSLSPQQEQLWREQQDAPACRASITVSLTGLLDAPALQGALGKVIARHEILRTTFQRKPGLTLPLQVIRQQLPPSWAEVDLTAQPANAPAQLAAQLAARLTEEARRPFDLERGPLVRASLFALGEERHVLALSLPCLVADEAALATLVGELEHLYAGAKEKLAEGPLQYAEFAAWENEALSPAEDDAEGKESAARGLALFRDLPAFPVPSLPFASSEAHATSAGGFAPASVPVPLGEGAVGKLAARARAHPSGEGIPAEALGLFAVFQVLAARLSGQPEMTLGFLSPGRAAEEAQGALGLYARTLPVPVSLASDARLGDILGKTARSLDELTRWQDYLPVRAGGSPGLVFAWSDAWSDAWSNARSERGSEAQARGVTFALGEVACHPAPFRAKLCASRVEGELRASLFYDRRFHRAEDMERIAATFARLVESAAEDEDAEVTRLAILTDADRKLLASLNQTETPCGLDRCLHHLFEEQAQRTPDRPALVFEAEQLTYAALDARANQIAHFLRKRGVSADTLVALCVDRSAEMIVGLLGILKAGGAYVPLLPDHPKARLAHQLAELSAPVLLTLEKHLPALPAFSGEVLCLDRDRDRLASESSEAPSAGDATGDSLAYVIYTSGSTGVPKGVGVCHRSVVNYTHALAARLRLADEKEGLRFATVSTIAADLGNTCIFPALVSGGCLHVVSQEVSTDGSLFADYNVRHGIDVLKITPSHLGALLDAAGPARSVLPRRYLVTGGEASSWDLCRRIRAAGGCLHINHYGPTETTIGSLTYGPVIEDDPALPFARTVPIGRPIANTEIHVVDQHLALVPLGAPGELLIGGAGLALGYLRDPAQSVLRFIKNPFSADPEARLYRTGDRVRLLPDGDVEFLGRVDQQVKIRGFRVEPAEIEAALRKDPAIREAVVVAREDTPGHGQLVAYVVAARTKAPRVDQLRAALQGELPTYMIPSLFLELDALPLTPNGKVDRKALPAPDAARRLLESAFMAPRNPIEEQLAAIWGEVLKLEKVSVHDSFFELGGHSLLAMQVVARVESAFQFKLTLTTFFDGPTIAGLADALERLMLAEIEGAAEQDRALP